LAESVTDLADLNDGAIIGWVVQNWSYEAACWGYGSLERHHPNPQPMPRRTLPVTSTFAIE
jgi:hypothetical protein